MVVAELTVDIISIIKDLPLKIDLKPLCILKTLQFKNTNDKKVFSRKCFLQDSVSSVIMN